MDYADRSINVYLKNLGSRKPTPGGGSSAALIGAIGCGLLSMVANFTLSAKGANGYKNRAKKALKKSEYLRQRFTLLIDKDIQAYEKLSEAFRRYDANDTRLQSRLKKAIMPPSMICDYAYRAAKLALEISYIGKKNILSDIIVAIYALDAAFEAGFINIKVNLEYIKNKGYAVEKTRGYTSIQRDMKTLKTQTLSKANERMIA
jgi:methenyltetrahydrofolate cyclohydrolase